jgi:putative SOS response-associated peptidase YedK
MCGRMTLHRPARDVADNFGLFVVPWLTPRYNIAPTQAILAVRADGNGVREGVMLRWGLVPSWSDGAAAGAPLINAKGETILDKPTFRSVFKSQRCLVPADGFFEWKAERGAKVPHYFTHAGGDLFAFAGLWERWEGAGQVVESVAIITTAANDLVRPVHDRMPVILPAEVHALWLDPARKDVQQLRDLLVPYPAERLASRAVGSAISTARNDGPRCIEPTAAAQGMLF